MLGSCVQTAQASQRGRAAAPTRRCPAADAGTLRTRSAVCARSAGPAGRSCRRRWARRRRRPSGPQALSCPPHRAASWRCLRPDTRRARQQRRRAARETRRSRGERAAGRRRCRQQGLYSGAAVCGSLRRRAPGAARRARATRVAATSRPSASPKVERGRRAKAAFHSKSPKAAPCRAAGGRDHARLSAMTAPCSAPVARSRKSARVMRRSVVRHQKAKSQSPAPRYERLCAPCA